MERGEVFHIGGHKVMFPFKPYPTQLDMMSKVSILSITNTFTQHLLSELLDFLKKFVFYSL